MSKEIQNILTAYQASEQAFALATVIYVEGSSYRRMGARMLVAEDGHFIGGISGGCLEGDALKRARLAILTDKPSVVRYDTSKDDQHQIGVGLGCNGIIDVLFKPINNLDNQNPIQILKLRNQSQRKTISYVTVIKSTEIDTIGNIYLVNNKMPTFLLPFLSDFQLLTQTQFLNLTPEISIFFELLPPPIHIYIYGNQYDIYPLIQLIQFIGWEYTVIAHSSKLKTDINQINPESVSNINFDNHSVALLMSHDLKTDKSNLASLSKVSIPYIGILGPKVRSQKIISELNSENIKIPSQSTLNYPMGLDLGAQSPEEIALSIVSEIKTVFSNRSGLPLKNRESPIYDRI
jgi:xanthine dehydrogenase accessory factor